MQKKRKEYNAMKKSTKKMLVSKKKIEYQKSNEKIKKLPQSDRKKARNKLRSDLIAKLKDLFKQLPSGVSLKTISDIEHQIKTAKKLKWV